MEVNQFSDLSHQQQQELWGGQNLVTTGGPPIAPLGKAIKDGSELTLGGIKIGGINIASPVGSLGNSLGGGSNTKTGAENSMILPPFQASNEVFS